MKTITNNIQLNMKKFSTYMRVFLIVLGISISSVAWADVTVTFVAGTDDNGDNPVNTITKGGVTITANDFSGDTYYQVNSSSTIRVSTSSTHIKQIIVTCNESGDVKDGPGKLSYGGGSTYGTYSYSGNVGTWNEKAGYSGSAITSVTLSASARVRFTQIQVKLQSTTCDLKVWDGSKYITWQTIDQSDALPCAPAIAGYYLMRGGTELCVWSTTTISTTPCVSSAYASGDNYRYAVSDPYLPKHYPNGATTLYAVYVKEGESCQTTTAPYVDNFWTVTFKANGGTGSDYTQKVVKSSPTKLYDNRFTNGCYNFAGWATSSGGAVVYDDGGNITATANTTLWAKWTPDGFVIQTAVSPAASGTATIHGETESLEECGATGIALVATPAAGYYFNNWTKSPNNSTGGTIASSNTKSTTYSVGTDDATLTANFLPYLHVTYNANGGSSAPTDANNYMKNANVSISNSIPTNTGYTFRGWATSSANATAGTVAYTRNQSNAFQITANTELWAVWCKTITGESLTVSGTTPTFSYSTGKGSCTFSWGSVTGATAYNLVIRNTTDGADVHSGAVSASSEYTFTNMIPGKTYRATVTASNACTETSGYVEKSIACPAIEWPDVAGDIVVSNRGKNSATVTFTITNATSFEVWLTDGTADGTEVVGSRSTITANSSGVASKEFTGLTNDHTYYVHATGENICGNETAEKDDVYFETAHQEVYDTYLFSCVTFGATVPSGKAYVTSGNGKTILSKNPVRLTITGAIANHYVQIEPSDANISVYFVKDDKFQEVNGLNPLRIGNDGTFTKDIYFAYTPSAAGDGSVTAPTFTVRCDGFEETFNSTGTLLKVRAMPDNFAIIAKVGNTWDILPADMGNANGTQPAVGVRVDNNTNPTIAYTEAADNAFRIWPIDAPGANRFKSMAAGENGSIIRLSMPNNLYSSNALAFGASESSTAIGAFNNATLTAVNAAAGSHFYWDVTTTEEVVGGNTYFKYNLKNPVNTNYLTLSGKKWGMYASGVQEVRFVKIEETKDAELTVMEWGVDQVVLRYPGSGTIALTSASVDDEALGSAHMERIGSSDLYILNDVTLQSNPSKALQVVVDETVGLETTSKESLFTIPFIISNGQTKNNSDLRTAVGDNTTNAIIRYLDVVVRKGGKLEIDNTTKAMFNDLYIYPGGKFEIPSASNNVSFQNVYLRGGFSWLNAEFGLPQMLISDGKVIEGIGNSGNGIYYDLYLNNNIYYMMALPKDVALASVTNEDGDDDWFAWVKGYSGKPRSLNPSNKGWSYVSGDNLERGKGYEIAIKPRKGRPYGTLRFPLMSSTAWSNETAINPAVVAWGMTDGELNEGVTANNAGWNLIGNPFFTAYNNAGSESILIADSLTKKLDDSGKWTGAYVWNDTYKVKYFTIPGYTTEDYKDVRSTPYKLDAFYPFFVQVNSGTEAIPASLTFGTANRALKMPMKLSYQVDKREVNLDIQLADEMAHTDVMGLNINNEYSSAFDKEDKEKTLLGGENYMKIYTLVGNYRVAFNSLSETAAAQPIPVGVITPDAGYYTFSLVDGLDVTEVEHVWLWDYEKSSQTDLLVEDYQFYSTHGQLEDRFAINVILKTEPEVPTDVEVINVEASDVPYKFIWQDHIYIMYRGVVYDITGRRVMEINK